MILLLYFCISLKTLNMNKNLKCCLCGDKISDGFGNNPHPIPTKKETDKCCDDCNTTKVIPERIKLLLSTLNN